MQATTIALTLGLLLTACGTTSADGKSAFLARCTEGTLRLQPQAAAWVGSYCEERWQRTVAAVEMAEAILAVAAGKDDAALSRDAVRSRLAEVQWSSESEGALGDLAVYLAESGALSFSWQRTGAEVPYNVIEALRLRGVVLRSLGCPQYPEASMGQEKVMAAESPGRALFTLTVYSRPAPTGIEPGLYQVDVDFSGAVPDMAALRAGRYPGGGGRAFAVDATGWVRECGDPD